MCSQIPESFQRGFTLCSLVRYEQPSGYRPAPVDLSQVLLSPDHEDVVNLLAENDHNVWARERIRQGWTYGTQQVYVPRHIFTLEDRLTFNGVLFRKCFNGVCSTRGAPSPVCCLLFVGRESEAEPVPCPLQLS